MSIIIIIPVYDCPENAAALPRTFLVRRSPRTPDRLPVRVHFMSRGLVINGAPLAAHAFTALPIAAARAVAHERSGAAVEDPLARKLLLGAGGAKGEQLLHDGANVEYMSLRKTLGDELVREMYESQTVRQVVSIGAGMDSRAFRLALPGVSYFEVDSQELFDLKEPLVVDVPLGAAGCTRRIVPGFLGAEGFDLSRELRAAGHVAGKPTVWLMEGLLPYLTREQCCSLASQLGSLSAPGSALWGDSFTQTSIARGMVFHGVPFAEGCDDYDEVFQKLGGFQRSEAFDMGGVELAMEGHGRGRHGLASFASATAVGVRIDPSSRITKETCRGRGMCVMVRAFKS